MSDIEDLRRKVESLRGKLSAAEESLRVAQVNACDFKAGETVEVKFGPRDPWVRALIRVVIPDGRDRYGFEVSTLNKDGRPSQVRRRIYAYSSAGRVRKATP